jgi:hypothetical protein
MNAISLRHWPASLPPFSKVTQKFASAGTCLVGVVAAKDSLSHSASSTYLQMGALLWLVPKGFAKMITSPKMITSLM